jgi:hypothetical protein
MATLYPRSQINLKNYRLIYASTRKNNYYLLRGGFALLTTAIAAVIVASQFTKFEVTCTKNEPEIVNCSHRERFLFLSDRTSNQTSIRQISGARISTKVTEADASGEEPIKYELLVLTTRDGDEPVTWESYPGMAIGKYEISEKINKLLLSPKDSDSFYVSVWNSNNHLWHGIIGLLAMYAIVMLTSICYRLFGNPFKGFFKDGYSPDPTLLDPPIDSSLKPNIKQKNDPAYPFRRLFLDPSTHQLFLEQGSIFKRQLNLISASEIKHISLLLKSDPMNSWFGKVNKFSLGITMLDGRQFLLSEVAVNSIYTQSTSLKGVLPKVIHYFAAILIFWLSIPFTLGLSLLFLWLFMIPDRIAKLMLREKSNKSWESLLNEVLHLIHELDLESVKLEISKEFSFLIGADGNSLFQIISSPPVAIQAECIGVQTTIDSDGKVVKSEKPYEAKIVVNLPQACVILFTFQVDDEYTNTNSHVRGRQIETLVQELKMFLELDLNRVKLK